MVVPGLAEPEGLGGGCGIDTIGSGPAAWAGLSVKNRGQAVVARQARPAGS
jgi:hypothetical protein